MAANYQRWDGLISKYHSQVSLIDSKQEAINKKNIPWDPESQEEKEINALRRDWSENCDAICRMRDRDEGRPGQ